MINTKFEIGEHLAAMSLDDMREIGYALEPLLDERIRARSEDVLREKVLIAMSDLFDLDRDAFDQFVSEHIEADEDEAEAVPEADPEAAESDSEPEDEPPAKESKESNPEAAEDDSYAIQIREHTVNPVCSFGDICIAPSEETREGYHHARLTKRQVTLLTGRGYKVNSRLSNG